MTMTMKRSLTMTRPAKSALAQERMRPPAQQTQQALRAVDDDAVAAAEGIVAAVTGVAGRGEREEDVARLQVVKKPELILT